MSGVRPGKRWSSSKIEAQELQSGEDDRELYIEFLQSRAEGNFSLQKLRRSTATARITATLRVSSRGDFPIEPRIRSTSRWRLSGCSAKCLLSMNAFFSLRKKRSLRTSTMKPVARARHWFT